MSIFDASMSGNVGKVVEYLQAGMNPDVTEDDTQFSWTPIENAACSGMLEVIKVLLEYNANLHTSFENPLRLAAAGGHLECLKYLLAAGADVHAVSDQALYNAVSANRLECARELIYRGADLQIVFNVEGRCVDRDFSEECLRFLEELRPVHAKLVELKVPEESFYEIYNSPKAIQAVLQETATTESILRAVGVSYTASEKTLHSEIEISKDLIQLAISDSNRETVEYLLETTTLENRAIEEIYGWALRTDNYDIVRKCREKLPNTRQLRNTLLLEAAVDGNLQAVQYLVNVEKADPSVSQSIAIQVALRAGHYAIAEFLLEVSAVSEDLLLPEIFEKVIKENQFKLFRRLLKGRSANSPIFEDALRIAVQFENTPMIQHLLDAGTSSAQVNPRDIEKLIENRKYAIVMRLLTTGANWQYYTETSSDDPDFNDFLQSLYLLRKKVEAYIKPILELSVISKNFRNLVRDSSISLTDLRDSKVVSKKKSAE